MNSKRKGAPALDYRLDVQDFGPIARASVEMRPLTVFIGPSNTGKSYLAMLLYVLHRCLVVGSEPDLFCQLGYRMLFPSRQNRPAHGTLLNWYSSMVLNESPPPLPSELVTLIHADIKSPRTLAHVLDHQIRRCFGVDDLRALTRRGGERPTVVVSGPQGTQSHSAEVRAEPARYEVRLAADIQLTGNVPLEMLSGLLMQFVRTEKATIESLDSSNLRAPALLSRMEEWVARRLLGAACRQAYYLPADRTGVMHSHQVVVGSLVQNAPMASIRPTADMPTLSGVLADFLYQLINMAGHRRRGSNLAKQFEESLLAGAVRVETAEANYPTFLYRPRGWEEDLPLMRTSSMVSELAPVVLYLRHVVRRGDVLIVEEPEAHLHPAMQAAFARELAGLFAPGCALS